MLTKIDRELLAVALVVIGVLMLTVGYAFGLTDHNILLFSALFLIVAGIILYTKI